MMITKHPRLSGSHYRLWSMTQNTASGSLNIVLSVSITGPIDIVALEASLADVIERHHSLRTGIRNEAGEPVPFLHSASVARPRLSAMRPTPTSISVIVRSIQQTFSLAEEIPLRIHLLTQTSTSHVLYFVAHPMALDPSSVRSLVFDLMDAYDCRCKGKAVRWSNPAPQYSDYLSQQRLTIGEESDLGSPAARQLAFWRHTLCHAPRISFPAPPTPCTGSPDGIPVRLNPEIHRRLCLLGGASQANLLMVLHSVILLVLGRLTGNSEIVIATLVSGREHGFLRDIVGSLANVINVRAAIQKSESLARLLDRVRASYIDAYANSGVDWARVVEACGGTDVKLPPAAVMLTIQKRSRSHYSMDIAGIKVENNPMSPFMFGCDLAFDFVEWCAPNGDPQGIEGRLRCNFSRVDKAFLSLVRTEFLEVLRTVVGCLNQTGDEHVVFDPECTPVQELLGDRGTLRLSQPASGLAAAVPDRKKAIATRSHDASFVDPFRVYVADEGLTQSRLTQIWEEVLGLQRIGIWDNFFDLGGDEVLFASMIRRISATYREDLSIQCVERYVTVAGLSAQLAQRVPSVPAIRIQAGDADKKSPFWFLHGDFHGRGLYCKELCSFLQKDQPFYVLPPHGINGRSVPGSIEGMAADSIKLIRKEQPHGSFCLGGYCIGGIVALEMAKQLEKAGENVDAVIMVGAPPHADPQSAAQKRDHSAAVAANPRKAQSAPALSLRMNVEDTFIRYTRAGELYSAQHYPGKVFLLCPSEKKYPADDPISGWYSVIADLTVRRIPGGHLTALTRHIGSLGSTIAEILATAGRHSRASLVCSGDEVNMPVAAPLREVSPSVCGDLEIAPS